MAVAWVLRKVMGKTDGPAAASSAALETDGSSSNQENRHCCCQQVTLRWIVTVVLSLQLLVFILVSMPFHGRHHGKKPPVYEAPVVAMFKLQRSAHVIEKYKSELEMNLSRHISHTNMKVALVSVKQVRDSDYAEVLFGVLPEPSNRSLSVDDINSLRGNLVKLFLKEKNLSLSSTRFGKAYDFQIDRIRGGITIVPEKSDKSLSRRSALFNFTLHNATLSSVNENFADFNSQLAYGLCLQPNENLITRFTNLEGSTIESPVIVQTSVFRKVGHHLPLMRLRQLAQHVNHSARNLGLNHTMFGKVRDLQLSSVLKHYLGHGHVHAPGPGPGPVHAPSPGPSPLYSYYSSAPGHSPRSAPAPTPAPSPVPARAPSPVPARAPTPHPVYPVGTGVGFGQSSGFSSDSTAGSHQGISSVPAASPSSSATCLRRLSGMVVLVASAAIFFH